MRLDTRHFGTVEVDDDKIISFPDGLPGFENHGGFVLLTDDGDADGFTFLQSVTDSGVCFILIDATSVFPDYNPTVEESETGGILDGDYAVLNIAKLTNDLKEATVNLKAPVIINHGKRTGRQVICSNDYSIRQRLFAGDMERVEE
jgi:flagellar assembly factor FliW